jgi:transcriptional regulator with XRE-family HTH domain
MTTTLTLGQRISDYCYSRDWTQEQFALNAKVSLRTITRARAGQDLNDRTIFKLERILQNNWKGGM